MTQPDPSQLEAELLAIRAANGGILTAAAIVSAATPAGHPLHTRFEWDDQTAAHQHRLQQARRLVRVVREQYIDKRGDPQQIRVFHSLPNAGSPTGRAYVTLEELKRDEVLSAHLLRQMEIDWRNLRRRYSQYEDWWKMVRRDMNGGDDPGGDGPDGDDPLDLGDDGPDDPDDPDGPDGPDGDGH